MKVLSFSGGVYLPHHKDHTKNIPTQNILPKKGWEMVFPVSQHIGTPCSPIVQVGDDVLVGQKIAESTSFVSAPVHSSVSGIVSGVRNVSMPMGGICKAIIVINDGEYRKYHNAAQNKNFNQLTGAGRSKYELRSYLELLAHASREEILQKIKEAGIVGLGGAGFPTHAKLSPSPDKKIEYIIANAAECEPYLTTDYRSITEELGKLIMGIQIIMSLHKGAKGIIAVETNKPDIIRQLEMKCRSMPDIKVVALKTKYPQGSEKQMVYACTGRETPSGGLPVDVGCIVSNASTIMSVFDAVVHNQPLIERIITISGDAAAKNGNYRVPIGTKLSDLLDGTGNSLDELSLPVRKIIYGGPMMGAAIYDIDVPIIKTTSAFLLFSKQEPENAEEQGCIRCGRCMKACPMGLMPLFLNQNMIADDTYQFKKNSGFDCIECGCCSYVCPAKRHLAQSIKLGKRGE